MKQFIAICTIITVFSIIAHAQDNTATQPRGNPGDGQAGEVRTDTVPQKSAEAQQSPAEQKAPADNKADEIKKVPDNAETTNRNKTERPKKFVKTWWQGYTYDDKNVTTGDIWKFLENSSDSEIADYMFKFDNLQKKLFWPKIISAVFAVSGGIMWAVAGENQDVLRITGMSFCITGASTFGATVLVGLFLGNHYIHKGVERYNKLVNDGFISSHPSGNRDGLCSIAARYSF